MNQLSKIDTPARRPAFFSYQNGEKAPLPFSRDEYAKRLSKLRALMADKGVEAMVLTSMHNVAYYSGFLYCAFGRPYACVVTVDRCVTVSANIDAGQPWRRSVDENLVYTDWQRDNYWRAIVHLLGQGKRLGFEGDHLTLSHHDAMVAFLAPAHASDLAPDIMGLRLVKSAEEIALIKAGANVADVGGAAIKDAIRIGTSELEIAAAGRDAMEAEIAKRFPNAEYRDTWVWFQSGINTDGAHNPVTHRKLEAGDILSMNCFPMINGYYTALERTLFIGEPDAPSLRLWEANVAAHELGLSLIKPGVSCADICQGVNAFFDARELLPYRSFGYGHSFGVLSHYYGREAGLELREDVETVLEPNMVISMEPMLTIPADQPGAGGYREHDILVLTDTGADNITGFGYGPEHCVVAA